MTDQQSKSPKPAQPHSPSNVAKIINKIIATTFDFKSQKEPLYHA